MNKWTELWDMCSGGDRKEDFHCCYIEAPEEEAKVIFYNKFGHNPDRVSCTCCGNDYSIAESDSLELATAFHREARWDDKLKGYDTSTAKISLEDYIKRADVKVIYKEEITQEDREGEVPKQGYIYI